MKAKLTAALAALFTPEATARNAGDVERVINHLLNLQRNEQEIEPTNALPETGGSERD